MHFALPMGALLKRGPIVSKDQVEAHYRNMFGQTDWLGLFMSPDSPIDAKLFKIEADHRTVIGEVDLLIEQAKDCMNIGQVTKFPFNICAMVNDPALNLRDTAVRVGVTNQAEFKALLLEIKTQNIRSDQDVPHLYRFSLNNVESMTADLIEYYLCSSNSREMVVYDEQRYVVDRQNQVIGCTDSERKCWEFYTFSLDEALTITEALKRYTHDKAPSLMSNGDGFGLFLNRRGN